MSERGDTLRELLRSGIRSQVQEGAVRAVILLNSNMITNEFRLKVLREEIRRIEEKMSDEGPGLDKAVRRQLKWSEELREKVRESTAGPVDGEGGS